MLDYYELLGVPADSAEQDIRSSYRQRIRTLHPDRFGDDAGGLAMARQMSTLLNLAWETLSRPAARADYDSLLRHTGTPAPAAGPERTGPRSEQAWSTAGDPAADDRLLEALTEAEQHVLRAWTRGIRPGQLAELVRPVRAAAREYRARFAATVRGSGGASPDEVAARAVAAAYRDAVDGGGGLSPEQRRLLRSVAATAIDLLRQTVDLDSGSWLERSVSPAVGASRRHRAARAVSWAGVALAAVAAVAAGIDLRAGHGTPWLPVGPDGPAPTPGIALAGTTLVIALTLAFATLVGFRALGAVGGAAVPARPTVVMHLDAVDRIRVAAGRRFRTLPDREPAPAAAPF